MLLAFSAVMVDPSLSVAREPRPKADLKDAAIPESKLKGDIGTTQVIADLVKKGYVIFTPLVCEALPFDLVAFKDGIFTKIQCKYSSDGFVHAKTSWTDKNGSHKKTIP
jgi:hypothetical protein